ncbi:ABC transporter substrate-binding protein [Sciscionella marina]|uniref:ABC transporter substrate-binding protein n=1 Tax=Sciscionella marina TaxID=508770 RepID=UPI00037F727A|nr:ABC transporter substrate-binding protein [Sciscionella marina]
MAQRSSRCFRIKVLAVILALVVGACAPPITRVGAGGTLKIGIHGNSSERLDPYSSTSAEAQSVRVAQLFDGLTRLSPSGKVTWSLAVAMRPNATLDEWTVKLRPNVRLHDGRTFGAEDVIYSVRRILDPRLASAGAALLSFVDPDRITKVDDLTVRFRLKRPFSLFEQVWSNYYLVMVPRGFDPRHPIGTGPFRYVTAEPGRGSIFTRFARYWGGPAKIARLEILDLPSRQAEINALQGGQIDIAAQIPSQQADSLANTPGLRLLESRSNNHLVLGMRTDLAPFDDVRVRNAVRLLVDRRQVVRNAFSGHGAVADDLDIRDNACGFPGPEQRTQNIAQARRLLAEARVPHLEFSIATADDQPGMLELAQVVQQNALRAGVTVKINKLDTAGFLARWKEWPVATGYDSGPYASILQNSLLPDGTENVSRWNDKEFVALADELLSTGDPAQQCAIRQRMDRIQHDRGGTLIPAWNDLLTAYRKQVTGLPVTRSLPPVYYLTGVSVGQ